jgi:hypothetical protein
MARGWLRGTENLAPRTSEVVYGESERVGQIRTLIGIMANVKGFLETHDRVRWNQCDKSTSCAFCSALLRLRLYCAKKDLQGQGAHPKAGGAHLQMRFSAGPMVCNGRAGISHTEECRRAKAIRLSSPIGSTFR